MAKSLTRMIQEVQKKYGCASVNVVFFSADEYHPKGWWSACATRATRPEVTCESVLGFDTPKEALAALCAKFDEILAKQEAPAKFQAASAAWF